MHLDTLLRQRFAVSGAIALVAAVLSAAALPVSADRGEPKIRALRAVADAYVTSAGPTTNFGTTRALRLDGSPAERAFLRFRTKYLQRGVVKRVNLLVFSRTRSARGFRVRLVIGSWGEREITYENAPRLSSRFVASGPVMRRAWKAVDVTALVDKGEDEVSLALTTLAPHGIELASRESGMTGPRLVVELKELSGPDSTGSTSSDSSG